MAITKEQTLRKELDQRKMIFFFLAQDHKCLESLDAVKWSNLEGEVHLC